ncbi:DUF6011 domain-containing protein [Bacillus sp. ISL-45]|nr:DUF6011 domain-containing protein [Bacillus sp. ISL-45]MBT2661921.1 hypothetical protein [Bacillus sp. ISL-45]
MICPVCNRQLKSQKSIARGMGPVCARKLENSKDNHDENQMKLELKDGSK